jgi:hypothetical protein
MELAAAWVAVGINAMPKRPDEVPGVESLEVITEHNGSKGPFSKAGDVVSSRIGGVGELKANVRAAERRISGSMSRKK